MTTSKTPKIQQHSISLDELHLNAPRSWDELSQKQLHYVLSLIAHGMQHDEVKTYMLIRFCNIEVIRRQKEGWKCVVRVNNKNRVVFFQRWQIVDLIHHFNFIDSYEGMNVRLETIQGLHAVDIHLHGLPFVDYLNAEKAYQGYLMSKKERPLISLIRILYRDEKGMAVDNIKPDATEALGVVLWYSYVKSVFNIAFPHFFRPAIDNQDDVDIDIVNIINIQIRALTGGDITKEDLILHKDCWRALTELDAKAKDAIEVERLTNKNK
jgi:hypothetical protein